MSNPRCVFLVFVAAVWSLLVTATTLSQSAGDQMLDGIGETSLIARYTLDGTAADRSRNGFDAKPLPAPASFVQHRMFGTVLSLSGAADASLELPAKMLAGADAISVVAWVRLRTDAPKQGLVHFDKGADAYFTCALTGENAAEGYRSAVTSSGAAGEQSIVAPMIVKERWAHVAFVLDAPNRSLALYMNGARVARREGVVIDVQKLFDAKDVSQARLRIGAGLDGMLRDVRFYSVALSDSQIETIHKNVRPDREATSRRAENVEPTVSSAPVNVDVGGPKLVGVPDINVTTTVGHLPKLPATIAGAYETSAPGRQVRVVWPAPKNNIDVAQPGIYTVIGRVPGTEFAPKAVITVEAAQRRQSTPQRALQAFALGDVTLEKDLNGRDTPFIRNRDKFVRTMAETNPDSFLYMFRDAFGQPQPAGAKPLEVWDGQTTRLRGHATGHYLSAIAQAYAGSSYDPDLQSKFLGKMNYTIDTLHELSRKSGNPKEPGGAANADPTKVPVGPGRSDYDSDLSAENIRTDYWNWGRGFLSAYPPDQFIMLERGASYGTKNDQIWAPYYTLHKIIAGLLDCYEVGGNEKALEVASDMGLWSFERLKALPATTRIAMWNRYIAGEYGGMNEVMARLNRLTGDARFLEGAKLFDNIEFFYGDAERSAGMAKNVDMLRGKHANQHIPQIIGAVATYSVTRAPEYFQVADNFWDITTASYTYSIGGVAGARSPNNAECFTAEPDTLWQNGFSQGGQNETCATYNMLKLSRELFQYQPSSAKYMNYYERALYNDILASVAEHDAGNTYHIPLNPGARKGFGNESMDGFTCCNGTALESNTKMQDSVYFKRAGERSELYVNLYVPSTLNWRERNTTLRQETNFPYADTTQLTITGDGDFDLLVRVPDWATAGFFVKVNGVEKQVAAKPNTYVSVGRGWKDGEKVELRMPFSFHLSRLMDQPNMASIMYGPIVLAAEESAPRSDWRAVKLNLDDLSRSITGSPETLRFQIGDVMLKPFFESYGRYSVYFDVNNSTAGNAN